MGVVVRRAVSIMVDGGAEKPVIVGFERYAVSGCGLDIDVLSGGHVVDAG
jgi:hypothetical protein